VGVSVSERCQHGSPPRCAFEVLPPEGSPQGPGG
jgi:hypothetical protein